MKPSPDSTVELSSDMASFDSELLGDMLAEGARLVASGGIPREVIEENDGHYALCRIGCENHETRRLSAGSSITVGRAAASGDGIWSVSDRWLSKAHFRVSAMDDGTPFVEDLESRNGTTVNHSPVTQPRRLFRGDCIFAGHSAFLFL